MSETAINYVRAEAPATRIRVAVLLKLKSTFVSPHYRASAEEPVSTLSLIDRVVTEERGDEDVSSAPQKCQLRYRWRTFSKLLATRMPTARPYPLLTYTHVHIPFPVLPLPHQSPDNFKTFILAALRPEDILRVGDIPPRRILTFLAGEENPR